MKQKNKIVIGNWKMNKDIYEAKIFMNDFNKLFIKKKKLISKNVEFGFIVPSIDINEVKKLSKYNKYIGAQNMYYAESGAFTGELSPQMITSVGANCILIGHSERRNLFHETDTNINKKIKLALKHNLIVIFCIGETLEEHNSKKEKDIVARQIHEGLLNIDTKDFEKIIIAYEPIWAIGTGKTATPEFAQKMCAYIRSLLPNKATTIQYGGSVKPENILQLLSMKDIDGALVGGASLDPKTMIELLTLTNKESWKNQFY